MENKNGYWNYDRLEKTKYHGAGLDSEPEKHIGAKSEIRAGLGNGAASSLVSGF